MPIKKKLIHLFIIIIIFIAGFLIGANTDVKPEVFIKNNAIIEETDLEKNLVSLMIDYGNGTVKTYNDIEAGREESVFTILQKVSQKDELELKYNPAKDSFGVFITNIGGMENDNKNSKWWTYWVNNKMAQVAADQYILQNRDVIEWKYGAKIDF